MKTAVEIIEWYDRVLPRGPILLDREEWQSLKKVVLAAQTTNISVMPCLQEQCINFPNGCSQCCHLERPSLSEART